MKNFLLKNHLNISFNEYKNIPALSSHFIMGFADNNIGVFRKKDDKDSKAFSLGTAVDTYLLDKDNFYKNYVVIPEKPTASLGVMYDYIKDIYYPTYKELPDIIKLLKISSDLKLWERTKDPVKRSAEFTPKFLELIELIPTFEDKIPISEDDELFIKSASMYLERNLYNELFSEDKFRINHFQIVRDIQEFGLCKCEIDQLEVDFKKKVVTITDIKTGEESAHEFEKAFYKYKYWIQSGFYKHLVADLLTEHPELMYFSVKCKYIYISKNQIDNPVVWDLSNSWYNNAMYGWKSINGWFNKGIYDLVDEITWHVNNQKFNYPREAYENNGRFVLKTPEEVITELNADKILEI